MEYLLTHWRFNHAPVNFTSCTRPRARRRACTWLLENTCSFDTWVLSVWLFDRCHRPTCQLARVACACLARKYHANDFHAGLKRNNMILGCVENFGYSLSQVMSEEKRVLNSVGWTVPSFQMSVCIDVIAREFFRSKRTESVRVLKQVVMAWLMRQPLRSCAWVCIIPTFAGLRVLGEDDTKWLRALGKSNLNRAPFWLPIGWFIELASTHLIN